MTGKQQTIIALTATATILVLGALAKTYGGSEGEQAKPSAPPQWILETYAKKTAARSRVTVRPADLSFEAVDLNADGHPDWLVYSSLDCGNRGCVADVYAYVGERYCYVGATRYGDAPQVLQNKFSSLKCATQSKRLDDLLQKENKQKPGSP